MCWRSRAAAWISVRWSIAQWTSVSPASARHVAAASPRPVPRPSEVVGGAPQGDLVGGRQGAHGVVAGGAVAQVGGGDAGDGRAAVLAAEQVDPAVEAPVLGGDVGGRDHVDHPVGARRGPQHHEAPARVVHHLEVNPADRAVQGAREQGAEGPTCISGHATQHGQSRMEIYGRGFAVALDDQAFHQHVGTIGASVART